MKCTSLSLIVFLFLVTIFFTGCVEEQNVLNTPSHQQDKEVTSLAINQELLDYYHEFLVFIQDTTTEEQLFETEKQRYNPENLDLTWTNEITATVNQDEGILSLSVSPGTYYYGSMRVVATDSDKNIIMNSTESPVYISGEWMSEIMPGVTEVNVYTLTRDPLA